MSSSLIRSLGLLCLGGFLTISGIVASAEINEATMRQMRELYDQAEKRMEAERFDEAREFYRELLTLGQDLGIDQRTFMELSFRLAKAQAYLKDYRQAGRELDDLMGMQPPEDLALRVQQLRARIYAEQGEMQDAFTCLRGLHEKIPTVEWSAEDRDFFVDVIRRLNQKWEEVLVTAERLFEAGLYEESVPFYSDVVDAVSEGVYPDATTGKAPSREIVGKIRYRMAQAYFLDGKYEGVTTVLEGMNSRFYEGTADLKDVYLNSLYLLGTSARRINDYETATRTFASYLNQGDRATLPHYEDVHYELGLAYYDAERYVKARRHFEELTKNARDPQLNHLSKLYLARIDFMEGNFENIEPMLASFSGRLATDDPLQYEVAYLRGEAAYQLGHFSQAATHFQDAIPARNRDQAPWYGQVLLNMGWSYLRLGDDPRKDLGQVAAAFAKAENAFRELLAFAPTNEPAKLALARVLMARHSYLGEEEAYTKLAKLLSDPEEFQDLNSRAEALAIKAEALTARAELKGRQLAGRLAVQGERIAAEHAVEAERLALEAERRAVNLAAQQAAREDAIAADKGRLREQLVEEAAHRAELGGRRAEAIARANSTTSDLVSRGDAAATYAEREEIYRQLTNSVFKETDLYAQGWYLRGLNHFEEAQALQGIHRRAEANERYNQAIDCFFQAYDLLREKDRALAGLALKYQAEAYFQQGTYEGRFMAFSLLDRLFTQDADIFQAMRGQDEVMYLRGLAASHLMKDGEEEKFSEIAESSLREVLKRWPNGRYSGDALYVLGTVVFQQGRYAEAEQAFVKLANEYPFSDHVGDAWFWAAEGAERLNRDRNLVRRYRRRVFEEFPNSLHAPEAYFKAYSYAEYLQGSEPAIEHLVDLRIKYPNSPFLVVANYLLGLDYKSERFTEEGGIPRLADLNAASTSFEEAKQHFDFCYEHGLITSTNLEYLVNVRYRAILEKGRTNLEVAKNATGAKRDLYLDYAEQAYREVAQDFQGGGDSLVVFLGAPDGPSTTREEAELGLAQTYAMEGKDALAERTLAALVMHHKNQGLDHGYHLSLAWYEQGKLAARQEDHEKALAMFDKAEEASLSGRLITSDELLQLYLEKATGYAALNQLDQAMELLTQVVNKDSTSPLRTEAMYRRAEIYEMQGRRDLAVKQLRATIKKGGEWAYRARDKLDKNYGFN